MTTAFIFWWQFHIITINFRLNYYINSYDYIGLEVLFDGKKYFYTKGDANNSLDNYVIGEEMIMGTINHYIPFIGYPTVLLNELFTE